MSSATVIPVSKRLLRRLLLAHHGLLAWSGGSGPQGQGLPWRESLRGPSGVLEALGRLGAIQLDPVRVVAENAHLVLWNRVGDFHPAYLDQLYRQKRLFEYWAKERCLLPLDDFPLFRFRMDHPLPDDPSLAEAVDHVRRRLAEGPLPARAMDTGSRVVSAWGGTRKATSKALELLWARGEVVVAFRQGTERHFALAQEWLPDHLHRANGSPDALLEKYLQAQGVVDPRDPWFGFGAVPRTERRQRVADLVEAGRLIPLEVAEVQRTYYLHSRLLPLLEGLAGAQVAPRTFLLPPLDNLLWDRTRLQELFDLVYRWEIYVPKAKRRYGPYAMPVLEGERFVAILDVGRKDGRLVTRTFWLGSPSPETEARIQDIKDRLADFLFTPPRSSADAPSPKRDSA